MWSPSARAQPFTGLLYLKGGVEGHPNDIEKDHFTSLKGKRVGVRPSLSPCASPSSQTALDAPPLFALQYVGEFGRIQCLELAQKHGLVEGEDIEFVRCGMDINGAIISGRIHAGVGIESVNGVELEQWCDVRRPSPALGPLLVPATSP